MTALMRTYFGPELPDNAVFCCFELDRAYYDALSRPQREAAKDRGKSEAVADCVRQMILQGDERSSLEIMQQTDILWANVSDTHGEGVFYVWMAALVPKGGAK